MTPFYLIDFENVQPKALGRLVPGTSRIKVFLGQNQSKLMLDLVQALQPFGENAQYIQISGSGPDAVDFHIAFYIGRLAETNRGASFTIISKDKGFDPLVRHLAGLGIDCRRLPEIPEPSVRPIEAVAKPLAAPKVVPSKVTAKAPSAPAKSQVVAKQSTKTRVTEVIARLKKSTKPAKLSTLRSSIKSWFNPPLPDNALEAVVQSLQTTKHIVVVGTKVTYNLG